MTDLISKSGWGASGVLDLTREQRAFLTELRKGSCRATAAQDASIIGPLIRANLVRWDDDPSKEGGCRKPQGSSFTLTERGEAHLGEHEALELPLEWGRRV